LGTFALLTARFQLKSPALAGAFAGTPDAQAALVWASARALGLDASLVALQGTSFPVLFGLRLGGVSGGVWNSSAASGEGASLSSVLAATLSPTPGALPPAAIALAYPPSATADGGGLAALLRLDVFASDALFPATLSSALAAQLAAPQALLAALRATGGALGTLSSLSFLPGAHPEVATAPTLLVAVPASAPLAADQRAALVASQLASSLSSGGFDALLATALPGGLGQPVASLLATPLIQLFAPPPPPPPPSPPPRPPPPPAPPPPPPPSPSPPPGPDAPPAPPAPTPSFLDKLKQGDEGSFVPFIFGLIIFGLFAGVCGCVCLNRARKKAREQLQAAAAAAAHEEEGGGGTPPELAALRLSRGAGAATAASKAAALAGAAMLPREGLEPIYGPAAATTEARSLSGSKKGSSRSGGSKSSRAPKRG
jgi:hypothetical protein